jgi:hypothetical protein
VADLDDLERRSTPNPMNLPPYYPALDLNVRSLVRLLNKLPGIRTIASCGGHADHDNTQWPAGSWFVSFRVAPTRGGWRSLERIAGLNDFTCVDVHSNSQGRASWCTGRSLRCSLFYDAGSDLKREAYNTKYSQNVPAPTPESAYKKLHSGLTS